MILIDGFRVDLDQTKLKKLIDWELHCFQNISLFTEEIHYNMYYILRKVQTILHIPKVWPRGYKTLVHSQTQNKAQ